MGFFELSKLLWFAAEPSNLAALLLGIALVLGRLGRRRTAGILVATVTLALLAVLALPVDQWIARPLESRFPHPALPDCIEGVIVLGGGELPMVSASRADPAVHDAGRYAALVMLARRYPSARLVFSGGSGDLLHPNAPEDRTARMLLAELGLDPARVTFEGESRTTWENLVLSKRLVQPAPGRNWILVTAALHMPRSIGVARATGWPMLAWSTDYETPDAKDGTPLHGRLGEKLDLVNRAFKEWVGLAAYRATGRSPTLLPAPDAEPAASCPEG